MNSIKSNLLSLYELLTIKIGDSNKDKSSLVLSKTSLNRETRPIKFLNELGLNIALPFFISNIYNSSIGKFIPCNKVDDVTRYFISGILIYIYSTKALM